MRKLPIGSDAVLRYRKVKDRNGVALLTGTGTYELREKHSGTLITNGNLTNVSTGTEGRYEATIDKTITVTLVAERRYLVKVVFAQSGLDDTRVQEYVAEFFE